MYSIPTSQNRTLTKIEFRRRLTQEEQELSDELEVTFETNPSFTQAQKRKLRTGFKSYHETTVVELDDPAVLQMLQLYVVIGILSYEERVSEILA